MSSFTDQTVLNRKQLQRQTFGILNSNSLHFIPISLLFLPFTFVVSATIQFYSTYDIVTKFDPFNLFLIKTIIANSQNILTLKSFITILAFIFLVILPTVAGIALITYSTNQAIHLRRLTFSSTFKSLSHSYIRLLSTLISGSMKLILLFLLLTLSPIAITKAVNAFGFHFGPFIFSIFINQMASYVLVITIVFFMVIWGSAASIAVLESKSGYESLQQSAKQSKEFRSHSFFILFLTGFLILPSLPYHDALIAQNQSTTNWILIMQVCAAYMQSSLMILYYVVANTVLYVQSKVARGEDIAKTTVDGDVSGEYVRVVVNEKDDEVSHELAIGNANGGFVYMLYLTSTVSAILMLFMLLKHA